MIGVGAKMENVEMTSAMSTAPSAATEPMALAAIASPASPSVGRSEAVATSLTVDEEQNSAVRLKKSKRKKEDRTEEEQAAHVEFRYQKRQARKARKRSARDSTVHEEPAYSFENGYRIVEPYIYEYRTFAKERWLGRSLIDMFTQEFGSNSPEYYTSAIASGRITVNDKLVTPDVIINNRDLIVHTAHRHEPPVLGDEVQIAYEDDELLVVLKPSSMPTHPCGAYRHNSLHTIVQRMRPDIPKLNIVHRLDRLTSGIVILAKTTEKAKALAKIIANREASKTYLARVRGLCPMMSFDEEFQRQVIATATANCSASSISFSDDGSTMHIHCPVRCLSPREAVWECHVDGKPSQTNIRVLRVDQSTTLLECQPVTGRTHQIRLHMQLIGFPIANDPNYGGELHFGESAERRAAITKALAAKAAATAKKESEDSAAADKSDAVNVGAVDGAHPDVAPPVALDLTTPQRETESDAEFHRRSCPSCQIGAIDAYSETQLHCSRIWLHALEYKLGGHVFRVPEPAWALPSAEY